MSKNYNKLESESVSVSEPITGYETRGSHQVSQQNISINERVIANTVSVDEYFDELITLVRKDYENI